jgi:hypothetical protein
MSQAAGVEHPGRFNPPHGPVILQRAPQRVVSGIHPRDTPLRSFGDLAVHLDGKSYKPA